MNDFIRFVGRGALAGTIFPFLFLAYYFGPRFGPLIFLGQLVWYLIPGASVGLILWLLSAGFGKTMGAGIRITIGIGISFAVTLALNHSDFVLLLRHESELPVTDVLYGIFRILLMCATIGGLAGLASPAKRLFKKAPELTYRERVRMYDAAESEARAARQRIGRSGME